MQSELKLRVATISDFTRVNAQGKRVWVTELVFYSYGSAGDLQDYRLDTGNAESLKRIKAALGKELIFVEEQE